MYPRSTFCIIIATQRFPIWSNVAVLIFSYGVSILNFTIVHNYVLTKRLFTAEQQETLKNKGVGNFLIDIATRHCINGIINIISVFL